MELLSGRDAQQTQNNSRQLMGLSSKWNAGDTLRCFYPIFWDDNGNPQLAVGAIWGHDIGDAKELGLGAVFIPSTCEFDRFGTLMSDPDITYQFSLIAPAFIEGKHQLEIADIESRPWPSPSAQREEISACDMKYSRDAKNPIRPIIGKVKFKMFTEVAAVKMVNDVPVEASQFTVVSQHISNQRMNEIYMILEDKKYKPHPGDKFLEVEWKFPVSSKKSESGRTAKPSGIANEYKLENRFPELYKTYEGMLQQVSMDREAIVHRAVKSVDINRVKGALTKYAYYNGKALDALTGDYRDMVVRNADIIKKLDFMWALKNEDLVNDINKKLAEIDARAAEMEEIQKIADAARTDATEQSDVDESTKLPVMQEEVVGAPKLSDILPPDSFQEEFVPDAKTIPDEVKEMLNSPLNDQTDDDAEGDTGILP